METEKSRQYQQSASKVPKFRRVKSKRRKMFRATPSIKATPLSQDQQPYAGRANRSSQNKSSRKSELYRGIYSRQSDCWKNIRPFRLRLNIRPSRLSLPMHARNSIGNFR